MGTARDEGRFWEIDTGHDLMITEPEAVTATLPGDRGPAMNPPFMNGGNGCSLSS